ncbi:class I adenylate-forming enzyme family protein [Aliiglaciecola sp. 3_MG-2023]|uniref:AMP-binding protein n=1 Tax=Aliiglaciecola sp. 3_MG-2023 TaxID=3062644 RepID=UPI0026E15069|nr:class I adenylate-forming enzyme family protein [Aliiglaciecola sp. 3_MG-2023]MDO6691729.1 class I adenylate-forming enzyme family protein [Aliiglaciecola sp. 3_MG-2023]
MKNTLYKSNQLIDIVKRVPLDRIFLTTKELHYTYNDIVKLSNQFKSENPSFIGRKCAVISDDRESLALYLPVFDSIFHTILLLPKDAVEYEGIFLKSAEIDYLIHLSAGLVSRIVAVSKVQVEHANESSTYILATSGTSGVPKLASYSLDTLVATAKSDINQGKNFTWGLTYDINRFAGLQVYLQSISSGSTLVIPSISATMTELITLFSRKSVNSLSGTPSFWRKLLMAPSHGALQLKRITLGGEISDQSVLSALSQRYSSAVIVHIYASTEAGVGFVVKDKKEGFPVSFLAHKPDLECQLKITNGNLWIKSTKGCSKYINGNLDIDSEGFLNTGDMVKIEGERVIFLGRQSGAINVGGNKVMPEKVESILEHHPSVAMAKVFSKTNPVLGSIVACEVVVEDSFKCLSLAAVKRDIFSFCKLHLESFEVPVLLKRVDSISINATGKKARN